MKNYLFTQRHSKDKHNQYIDSLENNYIQYFSDFQINIIPVPNLNFHIENLSDNIDISGIVLTGGGDVNPTLYGAKRNESLCISQYRDNTEYDLLNYALENDIPVLGICRGMQLINIFFGGKILKAKDDLHPIGVNHDVILMDKRISKILGESRVSVNSFHEFIIPKNHLSKELKEFAVDPSNNIEGYKHKTMPIWGIQWHPERDCPGANLNNLITNKYLEYRIN